MKRIFFLALYLASLVGYAQITTDATMATKANEIRNATAPGSNTAVKVGDMFLMLVRSKQNIIYAQTTAGTPNTYTAATPSPGVTSYQDGQIFAVEIHANNTGSATLNFNSIGARAIKKKSGSSFVNLSADDLIANQTAILFYEGTTDCFQLLSGGTGSSVVFGTDDQIPVMNSAGTQFEYTNNFKYDGTNTRLTFGPANDNAQGTYNYILGVSDTIQYGNWNHILGENNVIKRTSGSKAVGNNGIYSGNANSIITTSIHPYTGSFNVVMYGGSNNTAFNATQGVGFGGKYNTLSNYGSTVGGLWGYALGDLSWAHGDQEQESFPPSSTNYSSKAVRAGGRHSFNFSSNNANQTAGHGANGDNSAILGGRNHDIASSSPRTVIIGGDSIKARTSDPDQVYVPNLNIWKTPALDNAEDNVLTWNSSTKKVQYRSAATIGGAAALTASNGITRVTDDFRLGGSMSNTVTTLTVPNNTAASSMLRFRGVPNTGTGENWFEFSGSGGTNIRTHETGTTNKYSELSANLGSLKFKGQSVTGDTLMQIYTDLSTGTLVQSITDNTNSGSFKFYPGSTKTFEITTSNGKGVVYAADYASTFGTRSLIDKGYADGKLASKNIAAPGAGQDGQSIRWNNSTPGWEYFTPSGGGGGFGSQLLTEDVFIDGDAATYSVNFDNLNAFNIGSGASISFASPLSSVDIDMQSGGGVLYTNDIQGTGVVNITGSGSLNLQGGTSGGVSLNGGTGTISTNSGIWTLNTSSSNFVAQDGIDAGTSLWGGTPSTTKRWGVKIGTTTNYIGLRHVDDGFGVYEKKTSGSPGFKTQFTLDRVWASSSGADGDGTSLTARYEDVNGSSTGQLKYRVGNVAAGSHRSYWTLTGYNAGGSEVDLFEVKAGGTSFMNNTNGLIIGGTSLGSSSILQLDATTKALLLPRVTNAASVTSPVNGMIAYDAATNKTITYQGGAWADVVNTGGSGTVTDFSAGDLSPLFTTSEATTTTTPALTFSLSSQSANVVFAGPTSGGSAAPTFRSLVSADLPADGVTYAKMQNVSATNRFLGRITAGSGDPEELTGTQATSLLDAFTSGAKGLVPASGGGTTSWLRADGTFTRPNPVVDVAIVSGGGSSTTLTTQANSEQYIVNNGRNQTKFDATYYTQVRLVVYVGTASASANNPRLYPQYSTDGSSWTTIGAGTIASGDAASMFTGTSGTVQVTNWITLPGGAQADVWFRPAQNGGDASASPAIANVRLQFR